MSRALAAAIAVVCAAAAPAEGRAETAWGAQLVLGVPFNFPTPVRIRQEGAPDLRFRGRFATHPFQKPWYWGVGVFRRAGGREWSVELVHHKLYLQDPPPEVQAFSISHGFNLLLLGHGVELSKGVWAKVAGGAVIAHPESTVRGRELPQDGGLFGTGYHLAGPALAAGVEGRLPLGERARLTVGARLVGGYAVVPVVGGSAHVPNLSVHATAGLSGDAVRGR